MTIALERAIQHALDGHAMLFVGAGFSRDAKNLDAENLKTGTELAKYLAQECGVTESALEIAAEEYRGQHGDDRLIALLQREFHVQSVSPHHLIIAKVPWRRIYTTNYDNVLEAAYAKVGRALTPLTSADAPATVPRRGTQCIHLNGYVDRLTSESLQNGQFRLTDSAYSRGEPLDRSAWGLEFGNDIESARAIFFLGYSLSDLDLRRVLFASQSVKDKSFFVLGPHRNKATQLRAEEVGVLTTHTLDTFAELVADQMKNHKPATSEPASMRVLARFTPAETKPALRDDDVVALLLSGRLRPELCQHYLSEPKDASVRTPRYLLKRTATDDVIRLVKGGARTVVVHSRLGNGKTAFLEGLKRAADKQDFEVHSLTRVFDPEVLAGEVDQLSHIGSKALIVIDDYSASMDALRRLTRLPDNFAFILTARSVVQETLYDDLVRIVPEDRLVEVNIDRLDDPELDWIKQLLDSHGLWAEQATLSRFKKMRILRQDCGSEFHAILLFLLQAPIIQRKLQEIVDTLRGNPRFMKPMITALVFAVANIESDPRTLSDMWGADLIGSREFRSNAAVRQLVDVDGESVSARSSTVAQHLLRNAIDPVKVVDVLLEAAKVFDRYAQSAFKSYQRSIYSRRLGRLSDLTTLQLVLPTAGHHLSHAIRYYEVAKGLDSYRHNPLFWLQYAIACIGVDDLDRAGNFLKTAYAYAKERRHFDTKQIDNHYARYLLLRILKKPEDPVSSEIFLEAKAIIARQMLRESRDFPYRVARLYLEIYRALDAVRLIDAAWVKRLLQVSEQVLDSIAKLPEHRKEGPDVERCAAAMVTLNRIVGQTSASIAT